MSTLFISHSSKNNDAAVKVRSWLRDSGWADVFLDLDPSIGLAPGQRWQEELKRAGERCAAVLILLSPDWIESFWCRTEFLVARQLGKKIFPVLIAATDPKTLPPDITANFQLADISDPAHEAEGFARLATGMKRAGLSPTSFEWPPKSDPTRPIYPGLRAHTEEDAAIFFGRNASITRGLDAMRRLRDGAPERLLVILGASGAGKSSFLRAGLLSRLQRDDENFVVLPLVRPESRALTGTNGFRRSLATMLGQPEATLGDAREVIAAFDTLRTRVIQRFRSRAEAGSEPYLAKSPTVVVPIDQAEELFTAENTEATTFLDLLASVLATDPSVLVIMTIRSDSFTHLQLEPRLQEFQRLPFDLPPIQPAELKEVIEGPAALADPPFEIASELTECLIRDLNAADALPLLAFTLERLTNNKRGSRKLELTDYTNDLGGLQGAILNAVNAAFAAAAGDTLLVTDRARLEGLARAAFIPALVRINEPNAEPKRRVEQVANLSKGARQIARHFIDQRLLVSDRRAIDGSTVETVEVAHEAIFRQWPALKVWIDEERDALRAVEGVREAAKEWIANHESSTQVTDDVWLSHRGSRLLDAETVAARSDFASSLNQTELAYLGACRKAEQNRIGHQVEQIRQTRRLQRGVGIAIFIAAVIVVVAGIALARLVSGIGERTSETLAELARQASDRKNFEGAARYARAGLTGSTTPLLGFSGTAAVSELLRAERGTALVGLLRGHTRNEINAIAFSRDGHAVATGSEDQTVRLWRTADGTAIFKFEGHKAGIRKVAFSPKANQLASASDDRTVKIWDTSGLSPKPIASLSHDGRVFSLSYSSDGAELATGTDVGSVYLWRLDDMRLLGVNKLNEGQIRAVDFSPNGKLVAAASSDGTGAVLDASTGATLRILRGHRAGVRSIRFSPRGDLVVTASYDATGGIWRVRDGSRLAALQGNEGSLREAVFSPNGSWIATACEDGSAALWDAAPESATFGHRLATMRGHDGGIRSIAFSADGRWLVTGSYDTTVRVWDARIGSPNLGAEHAIFRGHTGGVNAIAVSPSLDAVASASNDKVPRLWRMAASERVFGAPLATLQGHGGAILQVAFDRKGVRLASASEDATGRIWNIDRADANFGKQVSVLQGHTDEVLTIAFSPVGERILTGSTDEIVSLWQPSAPDAFLRTVVLRTYGHAISWSPDGARFLAGGGDGKTRLCETSSPATCRTFGGHTGNVRWTSFSHKGDRFLTASYDGTVLVWSAVTNQRLHTLRTREGTGGAIISAAFSPNDAAIATASQDGTARLWGTDSGEEIAAFRGHSDIVRAVSFSPDGKLLATGSQDRTVRIWNLAEGSAEYGKVVAVLSGHTGPVRSVAFSPDGQMVASSSNDRTIRLWSMIPRPSESPVAQTSDVVDIMDRACKTIIADERSRFRLPELSQAPMLDRRFDVDACKPTAPLTRLINWLGIGD